MSHNNSIKKLLNIKDKFFKIDKVLDENINGLLTKVVYATASKKNNTCPYCKNKLVKNGFKKVNIKMLKSSQFNTLLRVSKQRYLCKNCKKSFSIKLKLVEPNCSISNDVKLAIKLELKECRAQKYIAKQFNVSASTVNRIINDLPNYKPSFNYLPESLCFDEFKSTKDASGAMSFIYCDAQTSKIIDIVEDRKLNNLIKYFSRFPKDVRSKVKHIVIDMYPPYISLIKTMFPNAKISIDRFHLIQLINRAFNKLRISIMNKQDNRMYNKLKKHWRLLLKNSIDLSNAKHLQNKMFDYKYMSQEDMVSTMTSCNRDFKASYNLYQDILIAINNKNFKKFKKIVEDNYNNFEGTIKIALKTFKKYFKYIENSLSSIYSNGRIEGVIRKIKVFKNIAYGYRSFFNFKKRILISANL
ncbi:MAG: ISL3 family transposase [Fusobacterium gastrosuis]|uniref:ISL3 family transposase n=2 Tax=Fusobacterium gastrosuis TaxID=1755100 RepID=UPI00297949D0|nr:ISL3 family transposase [Fusobacteriaceae bacterium]MDY4011274.1 ISL3 family transposase [Fusobacterium gastrosuis]MDY5713161.1 ISL3 family transposase [Fusobacterium gastrosuis]